MTPPLVFTLPGIERRRGGKPQPPPSPNDRMHHHALARITAKWRKSARVQMWAATNGLGPTMIANSSKLRIALTLVSVGEFDDDNLDAALKAIRDGICDDLWRDCYDHDADRLRGKMCGNRHDKDPRLAWRFEQERGPVALVRIGVEW